MTDLRDLLAQANIRRALIVDDAYDQVPLASDLSLEIDEWTNLFADIGRADFAEDLAAVREIYPAYDDMRADQLPTSDPFVAAIWRNRTRFRRELIDPLFARYGMDTATDRAFLDSLFQRIVAFGLECETAGRQFQERAAAADLIVIDLYLGSTQDEEAIRISIDGLCEVIAARAIRPPLVVLTSRSSRLEEKRQEFRDKSGLFESAFRIIRKAELGAPGKLERLLTRLANHYPDSLKLAAFVAAWRASVDQARERTSSLIRTLDLADHAQIKQLLLSTEGEPTGSYLVDVFDRVLQHEIEGESSIIDSAIALNTLTSESYPPPYVAGSRDLQKLVYRSLFQNPERLRLMGAEGSRVAFGDILRRRRERLGPGEPKQDAPLRDLAGSDIAAVLTPSCDLQRQGAKRILLLVGTLRPLTPSDWSYEEYPIRTPVIEMFDGQRYWISWNLKHIETLSHDELDEAVAEDGDLEIIARLRESHALELQQKLLSDLGRVGLIAPMPATFAMRVEAYLPNTERKLVRCDIPALQGADGVCYVGRPGQKDMRLVLSEDACEAICEIIEVTDLADVHGHAHEAVEYLRASGELLHALGAGISLPSPKQQGFKDILSPSGALRGDGPNAKVRVIGLIMRNRDADKVQLSTSEVRQAGIVLATWDLPEDGSETTA